MIQFKYQNEYYDVQPYFYKVITKNGKFYYGIKYSKKSANPTLFNINYFTSSSLIKNEDIKSFDILKIFYPKNLDDYVISIKKLKQLESRFLSFYKLIDNPNCLNRNYIKEDHVIFTSEKNINHLKDEEFRKQISENMKQHNPMFNVKTRIKVKKTKKDYPQKRSEISEKERINLSKRLKENNPMFDTNTKRKMVLNKMKVVVFEQLQILITDFNMEKIDDWDNYKSLFLQKYPNKTFFSYKTFKKWSTEYKKIKSIKVITFEDEVDVYDLTVEHEAHNFETVNNVYLKNCVSCHGRNIAQGSDLVIVNNLKCAYLGAAINCGGNVVSNVAQTVFCGI